MKYNYLIVGAGLFGSVFAHEAKKKGKTCLVIDKLTTSQETFTAKKLRESMYINMAHIFSIHLTKKCGSTLISLRNLTIILILQLLYIRTSFIICRLI